MIAHRGASGYAPEHTFAAWDLALRMGADYLEQDLQMTADGVLVVLHDETLDRTASGPGCRGAVRAQPWSQLVDCNVGSWFNASHPDRARPDYAQQRLATLDQVLARYQERARYYIETKKPAAAPGMERELLRLLTAHDLRPRFSGDDRVIVQSFSSRSLRLIHDMDPGIPLVQLLHRREPKATQRLRLGRIAAYAYGIGPAKERVDGSLLSAAHQLGLVVHPWTVNDEPEMRRLLELGVDGMFTDYPDRLIALRSDTA